MFVVVVVVVVCLFVFVLFFCCCFCFVFVVCLFWGGGVFVLFCLFVIVVFFHNKWASPCENMSSGICGHQRPTSACVSAQSDQDICCPLTESLDTIKCSIGKQTPG